MQKILCLLLAVLALAGCASSKSGDVYTRDQARREQTVRMGVVESVREVLMEGTKSPAGTIAGGAVGGRQRNSGGCRGAIRHLHGVGDGILLRSGKDGPDIGVLGDVVLREGCKAADGNYKAGVRPEAFNVSENGILVKATHVRMTGRELQLRVALAKEELRVLVHSDMQVSVGTEFCVTIRDNQILLFDQTGKTVGKY